MTILKEVRPDVRREPLRVSPRWLIRRDWAAVLEIERRSFEHPWTEADFSRHISQQNCIGMVAEHGDTVLGYTVYELNNTSVELLNLAVDPAYRHLGIGAQLAQKLVSKLSSHRRSRLCLNIRESNLPAQLFFRSQGLTAVRVLPGYFEDSGEDGYRFVLRVKEEVEESIVRIG